MSYGKSQPMATPMKPGGGQKGVFAGKGACCYPKIGTYGKKAHAKKPIMMTPNG